MTITCHGQGMAAWYGNSCTILRVGIGVTFGKAMRVHFSTMIMTL